MKLKDMKKNSTEKYYIVVEEWLYPTESGRNLIEDYDTFEEALKKCEELANEELENFENNCKVDAFYPMCMYSKDNKECGYIITPKNGLEEFGYMAKIIEVPLFKI